MVDLTASNGLTDDIDTPAGSPCEGAEPEGSDAVGKRAVSQGGVRVTQRVTETPVKE